MTNRQLFLDHIAQTSEAPMGLEITKAKGCKMWSPEGKEYIDLISGFSVANIGHGNVQVVNAITQQAKEYMHLMVYGEIIQQPQVAYAKLLTDNLPSSLDCVYFTNSGTEAMEGAMKLAKRYTGRTQMVAFKNAYHGSTQGALSMMGDEYWRNAYRPLLPDILHLDFNNIEDLQQITTATACVVAETVQAEAGVIKPTLAWIKALRERCDEMGTLLVLDEIQVGFGRTGSLWAFEQYGIVPDILLLGKALGGGMPLGAFIAHKSVMHTLTNSPVLGHISTFAGHPVCCAAGMAACQVLLGMKDGSATDKPFAMVQTMERLMVELLEHPKIKHIRSAGLLMAIEFVDFEENHAIIQRCVANGLITDWFLFAANCMRIAPPLVITAAEVQQVCEIILRSIDEAAMLAH